MLINGNIRCKFDNNYLPATTVVPYIRLNNSINSWAEKAAINQLITAIGAIGAYPLTHALPALIFIDPFYTGQPVLTNTYFATGSQMRDQVADALFDD